jgi:PKD repeat protein
MGRPLPTARFTISPTRPSTSDTIQLIDCSADPGSVGVAWRAWDLGDGSTSVGPAPVHRYSTAGEYDITLTVATFDGRVSSDSRRVSIRAEGGTNEIDARADGG